MPPTLPVLTRTLALAALGALLAATVAVAEDLRPSRDEALARYRAGNYEAACEELDRVVRREPQNGAGWADLGLCRLRLGRRAEAIHASLLAVRMAMTPCAATRTSTCTS